MSTPIASQAATPVAPPPAHPWRWIPTLYFAQGLPYVVVMTLSVVFYKNLGLNNTEIALYTSWLYLPWVIKPLWSPLVEMVGRKRGWIVGLQFTVGAALAMVALSVPTTHFFQLTLALFWLMAFASATHDIAADGFYMLALPQHQQAAFSGVRSTVYRLSMIAGQGGLVVLAGMLQTAWGDPRAAWSAVFGVLAAAFVLVGVVHQFVLPVPPLDQRAPRSLHPWRDFFGVFAEFFRKPGIARILAFLLLYRFAEAQLVKLVSPFLLDPAARGGLGLSTEQVGWVYGTVGVSALTVGGLLGGWAVSRAGLGRLLWPMVAAVQLPNLVYVALAAWQPAGLVWIAAALAVEQFGYGFGFAAYMLFMIMVAEGPHRTAHYAICTGFMALGMMLPGMISGWIQAQLGYPMFFVWVCVATLPAFAATALVRVPRDFGRKVE